MLQGQIRATPIYSNQPTNRRNPRDVNSGSVANNYLAPNRVAGGENGQLKRGASFQEQVVGYMRSSQPNMS